MRMSSQLPRQRYRMIVTRGVAVAACALLAAACGSAAAPGSASGPGTSGTSASGSSTASAGTSGSGSGSAGTTSAAKVSLDVTFAASPTTAGRHFTLRCDPAGGTAPDAATACSKLLSGKNLFGPKPAHVMCPMIMSTAGRATVTGTYLGKKVHETIVDGGCDLGRYQQLKQIFE
jgi:Subtilisin inhibitor-like